jgi:hypothetical protein
LIVHCVSKKYQYVTSTLVSGFVNPGRASRRARYRAVFRASGLPCGHTLDASVTQSPLDPLFAF